jgi:hypothetical protein
MQIRLVCQVKYLNISARSRERLFQRFFYFLRAVLPIKNGDLRTRKKDGNDY